MIAVGVEGTGSYGAGLARFVTQQGVTVVEIDRPDRKARRSKGKSDLLTELPGGFPGRNVPCSWGVVTVPARDHRRGLAA